jgi:hypothetical protein
VFNRTVQSQPQKSN